MKTSALRFLEQCRTWWAATTPLRQDALLYVLAAAFALAMWATSATIAESRWGALAAPGYVLGGLICIVAGRVGPTVVRRVRIWSVALVLVLTSLVPLAVLAEDRALHPAGNFAQPEVMVIERAGAFEWQGHSPYQSYWYAGTLKNPVVDAPAYESFFPYLPEMGVFGVPAAITHHHDAWADARVIMTLFTLLCLAIALWLLQLPYRLGIRVVQWMAALPTGAMFFATGGDDLPILGLLLVAVALLHRRRATGASIVVGIGAALKFTAWPLVAGAALVARSGAGRCAWRRVLFISALLVGVTALPFYLHNPSAFVDNVLLFPTGAGHVTSPAASDFPGHVLSMLSPVAAKVLQLAVVASGYFFLRFIHRHWPLDVARMLSIMAFATSLVICAATATRFGYVIYPMNFWLWSYAIGHARR